jgi:hypothetical protein
MWCRYWIDWDFSTMQDCSRTQLSRHSKNDCTCFVSLADRLVGLAWNTHTKRIISVLLPLFVETKTKAILKWNTSTNFIHSLWCLRANKTHSLGIMSEHLTSWFVNILNDHHEPQPPCRWIYVYMVLVTEIFAAQLKKTDTENYVSSFQSRNWALHTIYNEIYPFFSNRKNKSSQDAFY